MAGGGGGGGGKRSANAEINLVPYIDLLSTLICFLLITAVWQQVSVISTNSAPTPPPPPEDAYNPTPPDPNKVELSIKILANGLEVTAGKETRSFPHVGGQIDKSAVKPAVTLWKKNYPDKKEVTINSDPNVPYKFLIEAMDVLIEQDYTGLAINTN
ncbi:MAG: biopolymer transporter ExbD [Pseudobdellovibrio sp.]|jgi:biopolymer transport protein ExbD|nr:biopolymer transporter ExbD [Pseudobdellovibrio sp.]